MTLKYSTGARNFMAGYGSFKDAFQNGKIEIYSGSQPASADAAVTGTLLCTITAASASRTAEVLSSGTVTLSGASGSINTLTVNGIEIMGAAVSFTTDLTTTAAAVAAQINAYKGSVRYKATSSAAVVTITAMPGTGTAPNGFVVTATTTTLGASTANMSGGVAAANGLQFGAPAANVVSKLASQTWTGVNGATGTAGYYRMYGSVADAGGLDSAGTTIREDGAISTSGAELNMTSTSLASSATTTIATWDRTLPTL